VDTRATRATFLHALTSLCSFEAIILARSSISDFFVTLYSDDGSSEHNPALQLAAPYSMSIQTALLQVQRGVWFEQDITLAGWPCLRLTRTTGLS